MLQHEREPQERPARLLITIEEAAELLGIGRTHAYALIVRWKAIKSVKLGRTRRVVVADLEAYIQRLLEEE